MPEASWAAAVCRGLEAVGCRDVVYVPDNPLSHVLRELAAHHNAIRTTVATREEEAVGIAAGLYLGGIRAAVMMQSSGLGNSVNALASLHSAFGIPVLLLITMRGGEGEWNPTQHPMGLAVPAILDTLGVPHETIVAADCAEETIGRVGGQAFASRRPGACLLARPLWGAR
jgi:sulfopyruvate decarboxylase alpha subunit